MMGFWNGEDARAVAWVVAVKGVPAGAAPLLRDALRAEADALVKGLQGALPPSAPLPKAAAQDEVQAWMRADQRRRHAAAEALWGPYDALGEARELAPLDAALVERLRALGDTKRADGNASNAKEAMGLQHRHKTPPFMHWRTYHRDTPLLVPAGESWPPEVGDSIGMPLVGLEDVPPSATGLRFESVNDGALASLPAETRARLAKLSRAAWAEATQGLAPDGWGEDTLRDAVERYMGAVRALDWSAGWAPPVRLCALALALWEHGGVRARWEESCRKPPALTRGISQSVVEVMAPSRQVAMLTEDGTLRIEASDGRRAVAVIASDVVHAFGGQAAVAKRLSLLERVWFQNLVRLLVLRGHDAVEALARALRGHDAAEALNPDARRVVFVGGYQGLRDAIGYAESGNTALEEALKLGQGLQLMHGRTKTTWGLWTFTHERGSRGKPGKVSFDLSEALLPGFAFDVAGGRPASALPRGERESRKLVPVLAGDVPYRSAGVRANEQGRVLGLLWPFMIHYRDNADSKDGTVGLPSPIVQRWIDRGGLAGQASADAVVSMWADGDGTAPPLLEVSSGRVRLTDTHEAAREYMRLGRTKEDVGRANGRAHVASKEARRRRS